MKRYKAMFYRNCFDFDRTGETNFWFIIKDYFGGMEELSANSTRGCVRRALATLDIKRVPASVIASEGYEVYAASFERYGKARPASRESYESGYAHVPSNVEFWGCFHKESGRLVAYAKNYLYEDMCEYTVLKAIPLYMKQSHCYYGLIFKMNEYYLGTQSLKYVCDGARTLTQHSGIQTFLVDKFKFRKAYCRVRVHYRPWLGCVVHCLYPLRNLMPSKIRFFLKMEEISCNSCKIHR